MCLVFTNGATTRDGLVFPRAGWAFHDGLLSSGRPVISSGRVECRGPFGDIGGAQTCNRAELRAVVASLRSRPWTVEGFSSLVIATDSPIVVEGATTWSKTWRANGWKTDDGSDVQNQDLWKVLLGEVERAYGSGVAVYFWLISTEHNRVADEAAREAALGEDIPDWTDIPDMAC